MAETAVTTRLRPLGDRVVIKPAGRDEMTTSGLVLPDTASEKPQEGDVIAVGPGRVDEKGNKIPMEITVGARVLFAKYAGTEFKLDGDDLLILSEKDVLAIRS